MASAADVRQILELRAVQPTLQREQGAALPHHSGILLLLLLLLLLLPEAGGGGVGGSQHPGEGGPGRVQLAAQDSSGQGTHLLSALCSMVVCATSTHKALKGAKY